MASVTQQIPNYKLGISELPDELKAPGQVVDLKNGIPDITRGLIKRPGSDLVKAITPVATGKWFPIYREEDEHYIGQVATNGAVKIWRCSDGVEIPVDYALVPGTNLASYLAHTNSEEIQPLTVNQTTLFTNRTQTVAMLTDSANKSPVAEYEAYVNLKTIAYGKQYSLDVFDPTDHSTVSYNRATSIEADDATSGHSPGDGHCAGMGRSTVVHESTKQGPAVYSTSPPSATDTGTYARAGTTVTVTKTAHGWSNGETVTLDFTTGAGTDNTYTITSVADANTFTITDAASGTTSGNVTITRGKSNLRYEMDVRCVGIPEASSSTSTAYDDSYQPFATLQFGGEGWVTGDTHSYVSEKGLTTTVKIKSHVEIKTRANIALIRPEATSSNNAENVSAESILAGMRSAFEAVSGHGITATVTGNGLHLRRSTPFNITTSEDQLMEIITSQANDATELPKTCRNGYVVNVVNSGEDQDDYFLKFNVNNIGDETTAATYARSSATVTVTSTAHGLSTGDTIIADFTSGGATDGWYDITRVDADTFTLTDSASGTIGAGATLSYIPNRFGTGVWEECAAPDLEIKFDKDTMPLKLVRVGLLNVTHTVATSAVDTSAETITITAHGKATGTPVYYSNGSGTTLAGLTNNTAYYCIKVDADTIKLATNLANATAGTAINLTGTGNNAQTFTEYEDINGTATDLSTTGAYRFDYPAWSERDVGDDITNPKPSFVGKKVNKIFFYRNRIGLLAEENVILSRTNDFYNFWAKTAFTIANADPIDLQSSSLYPTDLFDAIEVNAGLLIFSASQQFLLSTDEAQMTPETARIQFISNYAFDERTVPFSLGVTAGWLNSTAKRTRFHEIAGIQRSGDPIVLEQSKIISKLFPEDCTLIAESTENSMVLFGTIDNSEIWGYKFYTQGETRIQSAWFRWVLPGTVTYHTMFDDTYYAVIKNGSDYTLEALDVKKETDTLLVGTAPSEYLIHLDTKKTIASADLTYVTATDKTTFTLGAGYYSGNTLKAYCNTDCDNIGKTVPSESITGSHPNKVVTLDGNWKTAPKTATDGTVSTVNTDVIIGYEYEMEVELPTIYIQEAKDDKVKSETRGSLVIHRINLSFGSVGLIDTTLVRRGRDPYTQTFESLEWDSYLASTIGIADDYIHTVPVYDRNTNLSIHLKSTHPSPAILHSVTWEGDYSNKLYKRV